MNDDTTVWDLNDEEWEDYENNPDDYDDITDNTNDDLLDMMYPDGPDEE